MRIEESIVLPVAAAQAWQRALVWEDQARWMKDAKWVRVVGDRRAGVGTDIRVKTLLYGIPAFVEPMEVIEWDPPRQLKMRHGSLVQGTGTWRIEPIEPDHEPACRFVWIEEIALRVPVIGELAARIYGRFMRRLMRGSLASLREFLKTPPVE
jgi:hypothetical protein